jgi:ABC-type sugar transport system ATPase subunit
VTGESGCGKSTFLRLLSGLLTAIDGDILLDGRSLAHLAPHLRSVSFMSQANSLFPGISIYENLMLALHDNHSNQQQKADKIRNLSSILKLNDSVLERLPSKVSGGQLSRANLARALLRPCSWLLLDEPFAAVDRQTRLSILSSLREWQLATKTGILLVSHDLDDVFTVATDVTIVSDGKIVENTTLRDAIDSPRNLSTARLLRAGLVRLTPSGSIFVRPDHLRTNRDQIDCEDQHVDSIALTSPQATRIGLSLRVIDLTDGTDVTISTPGEFNGTLWFDRRNAQSLSPN